MQNFSSGGLERYLGSGEGITLLERTLMGRERLWASSLKDGTDHKQLRKTKNNKKKP